MIPTPVKKAALEFGCAVIQPESVNDPDVIEEIKKTEPDFFVVVAFGQFLSEALLDVPAFAPINIHASLLPGYRGAAPINRSILNGDTKTGVTTMFMDKGMDSGDILDIIETEITKDDTAETLHDRLAELGADLIVKTIEKFINNAVTRSPQDIKKASPAPMLRKKEGQIDWNRPSAELDCFVRGMTPWPGAFTFFNDKRLKIFKIKETGSRSDKTPGTILESPQNELHVATGSNVVSIIEIQGASGKKLAVADFLRGFTINQDDTFT